MATKDPVESVECVLGGRGISREPNWLTGNLAGYPAKLEVTLTAASGVEEVELPPLQQSDLLKPLLIDIAREGLSHAYDKYCGTAEPVPAGTIKQTQRPRDVIVVGAGMAGMAAAYELKRVGHNVTILEAQDRAGGRVRTYDHEDGFSEGLHSDAGAMRLPGHREDEEKQHFLTAFYTEEKFNLDLVDFVNFNENAYLKFYNEPPVKIKEWENATFSKLWPGWDLTIRLSGAKEKYNIEDIDKYKSLTTNVVVNQLRIFLAEGSDTVEQCAIWNEWEDAWSQFALDGFLRSSKEALLHQLPPRFHLGLERLGELLPWPEAAITAYTTFTYTSGTDGSLVASLRGSMGHWGSSIMHAIKGGMSGLPKAFEQELSNEICFGFVVTEIEYESTSDDLHKKVTVKGYQRGTCPKQPKSVVGNAVIVTTPVNILRQMKFVPCPSVEPATLTTPPMPKKFYKAIEDIWYSASAKIMLECSTRFWETEHQIQGGFTRTNLPVGQVHYPSNPDFNTIPGDVQGGILLVYTWKSEALLFGALTPELAVAEAVDQIAEVHPQIHSEFVRGKIKSWYNEPAQQGAFAHLKPRQERNVRWLMYPWRNIYFAGEAISFANGWIQGALESSLRAAYQFYARNESSVV